jgi:hypothetical protein
MSMKVIWTKGGEEGPVFAKSKKNPRFIEPWINDPKAVRWLATD